MSSPEPLVIVHGGAGRAPRDAAKRRLYERGLADAARAGLARLLDGGSALDAAESAVRHMEASGAFNAGRGASLTLERTVECDAAVMVGATCAAGACGAVPGLVHAVTLARWVMEETDHVLLVGPEAARLARAQGIPVEDEPPSAERLAEHAEVLARLAGTSRAERLRRLEAGLRHGAEGEGEPEQAAERIHERSPDETPPHDLQDAAGPDRCDTVGAIAIDARGRLAAAVSTGGLWLKLPGRVGDSAIPGAGIYADDEHGAAVATGIGELILRHGLSRRAVDLMAAGCDAQAACERAVAEIAARFGPNTAGLIAIDAHGRAGAATNTEAMGRALARPSLPEPWLAVAAGEPLPARAG